MGEALALRSSSIDAWANEAGADSDPPPAPFHRHTRRLSLAHHVLDEYLHRIDTDEVLQRLRGVLYHLEALLGARVELVGVAFGTRWEGLLLLRNLLPRDNPLRVARR